MTQPNEVEKIIGEGMPMHDYPSSYGVKYSFEIINYYTHILGSLYRIYSRITSNYSF